jgi:hypothetical protein
VSNLSESIPRIAVRAGRKVIDHEAGLYRAMDIEWLDQH